MDIELTSELVTSAVVSRLRSKYTTEEIYTERVIAGITYPSFHVSTIGSPIKKLYANRYTIDFMFAIHYFVDPSDDNLYKKLNNVGVELLELLEKIKINNMEYYNKGDIETHKEDNIQVTTVVYSIPCKKTVDEGDIIEDIEIIYDFDKEENDENEQEEQEEQEQQGEQEEENNETSELVNT